MFGLYFRVDVFVRLDVFRSDTERDNMQDRRVPSYHGELAILSLQLVFIISPARYSRVLVIVVRFTC